MLLYRLEPCLLRWGLWVQIPGTGSFFPSFLFLHFFPSFPYTARLPRCVYVVSLADPFPTLRGEIRVWSLLIDRFVSFPTIHGELYLECIAYESMRFPGYAELIRAFVTRPVLPVAMDLKSVIYTLLQQSMVISFAVNRRKVSWHLQEGKYPGIYKRHGCVCFSAYMIWQVTLLYFATSYL